jgi:hypothetical protein
MQEQLGQLLEQAAECAEIAPQATDKTKQELFTRLTQHFSVLASEVEKAVQKKGWRSIKLSQLVRGNK